MKTASKKPPPASGCSIGELSRRTGLSVLRIRAWETRHGVPRPLRAESGHRRYSAEEALRLELLAQAVRAGGRIGDLRELDLEALARRQPGSVRPADTESDPWVEWVRGAREQELHADMARIWRKHGWRGFVDKHAIPFLRRIGHSWETGALSVAQEHFASGVLHAFLEGRWRERNASNSGDPLILAMLPGDHHGFGLHLCALAAVNAGRRVLWLGPNTPAATILSAVGSWEAGGLCLSLSVSTDWEEVKPFLVRLRREVDAGIPIYAGGTGLRGRIKGIHSFGTIGEFHDHLESAV